MRGRREQIIKIKEAYPDKTGIEIARELGISRQRVNLILLKGGYSRPRRRRSVKYCAECGKALSNTIKGNFCLACYKDDLHRRSTVNLTCAHCGKEFIRTIGYVHNAVKKGQKRFFCGRSCLAKWMQPKWIEARRKEAKWQN